MVGGQADQAEQKNISTKNFEITAAPTILDFYLIPESDLFVSEIWICSIF